MDLDLGLGVLHGTGDSLLLLVEVSELLLPLLDLVEDGFNVIEWIRDFGLNLVKFLQVFDNLCGAKSILEVNQTDKGERLLLWSGRNRCWSVEFKGLHSGHGGRLGSHLGWVSFLSGSCEFR